MKSLYVQNRKDYNKERAKLCVDERLFSQSSLSCIQKIIIPEKKTPHQGNYPLLFRVMTSLGLFPRRRDTQNLGQDLRIICSAASTSISASSLHKHHQ